MSALPLLIPDWPAPASVRACVSTRQGGVSQGPYQSLNLGDHVGDESAAVAENRRRFVAEAGLPASPAWLVQVHGCVAVPAGTASAGTAADACWTAQADVPCAILTADCLPVIFCDIHGTCVAAAHAGWRGLAAGVLESTLSRLPVSANRVMAWLGPAIGPASFQVGAEVRQAFVSQSAVDASAFLPDGDRWRADLFALARARLERAGVRQVYGGGMCTVVERARFFSHRRDGVSGRFATAVWLVKN